MDHGQRREMMELDPDGNPRFTFNSPQVVEAVQFLSSLIKSGHAFPPAGANSSNDSLALFRSGATSLFTSGSWDLSTLAPGLPAGSYEVMPMPKGVTGNSEGSVMGGSSLFVPKGSKHRELAFEFMKLVVSDNYALRFAKEEGRLPVRTRIYKDPYFQDHRLQVVLAQLRSAHPLLVEAFPVATKAYENALTSVLVDGADPRQALDAAQASAEESLGKPADQQT